MLRELIKEDYICETDRVAVGVSGGADSMLLLHALIDAKKYKNFYLKVINVNHHLRDEESDGDSEFVVNFCKKNSLDFVTLDADVKGLKAEKKKTLEEAARIARYNLINTEMKKCKLNKLFLAHHMGDNVETILMNICRGSGLSGATGIRSTNEIFRPLLNLTKTEILNLCKINKIDYVTDSSNFVNDCTRNYIRNIVIKDLEKVYPDVVKNIALFGERCNEIQKYIESLIDESLIVSEDKAIILKETAFLNQSFIVREYLKNVFKKLNIFSDIEAKHYKLLTKLIDLPVNSSLDLPHQITAKRVYSGIKFIKKTKKIAQNSEYEFIIGETEIVGYGKILVEIVSEYEVTYGDGNFYIDYYKVANDAVWRFRKIGDEFVKLGSGSKKLNDYFTDKKIDVDLRDKIPVLASGNHIYLVAEYDISESVKIVGTVDKIAKITFLEN